jgi:hypothetical protein
VTSPYVGARCTPIGEVIIADDEQSIVEEIAVEQRIIPFEGDDLAAMPDQLAQAVKLLESLAEQQSKTTAAVARLRMRHGASSPINSIQPFSAGKPWPGWLMAPTGSLNASWSFRLQHRASVVYDDGLMLRSGIVSHRPSLWGR